MSPGWIVGLTVVGCFGYVLAFWLLFEFVCLLTRAFKNGNPVVKLLVLIPIIVFGAIFIVLDIIHSLLCVWLGVQLMVGTVNWIKRTGHK